MTSQRFQRTISLEQRVCAFSEKLYSKYLEIFPTKTMVKSEYDKPWITPTIKTLIRERSRLYSSGKGNQGATKRNLIVNMIRNAKRKYGREKVDPLLNIEPAKWLRSVKAMSGNVSKTSVKISDDNGRILGSSDVNAFLTSICTTFSAVTPPPRRKPRFLMIAPTKAQ